MWFNRLQSLELQLYQIRYGCHIMKVPRAQRGTAPALVRYLFSAIPLLCPFSHRKNGRKGGLSAEGCTTVQPSADWVAPSPLTANRHLESFEPGTAYINKFSLVVSVICVTFARLHTLHHVAWNWRGGWICICMLCLVQKTLGVCWP